MTEAYLKDSLDSIYRSALHAVEPATAVQRFLRRSGEVLEVEDRQYDLRGFRRVFLVGVGKAAVPMAKAVEKVCGDYLEEGLVVAPHGSTDRGLKRTRVKTAGHPVPDSDGHRAALEMIQFLRSRVTSRDLLLVVISGGGSALLPAPVASLTLEDKQSTTESLLRCGATIHEINTIRKHLSQIKGGRLLEYASGSRVIALLLSDVIGDDLATIASGPTVPDPTSLEDCHRIIRNYDLARSLPASVVDHLGLGNETDVSGGRETPKPGDPRFEKVHNIVVGSNILALKAAQEAAESLGFRSMVLSSSFQGLASDLARCHTAIAREILISGNPLPPPCCIVSGGEPTVVVKGKGKGGRNQEFVLSALEQMSQWEEVPVLVSSLGSDGIDGPTDAAGAWATPASAAGAEALGLSIRDHLDRNDSYHFFQAIGHLIKTGPTQTNVMDIQVLLVGKR